MEACSALISHSLPCISFAGIHVGIPRTSGDLQLLGRGEFNLSVKPRKLSGSFMSSRMALGSNVSEDTDDMFDDLFKKYGKVVFKRNDQKPPSAEVDDDAESLSFKVHKIELKSALFELGDSLLVRLGVAVAVAKVASEVKAGDIRVLFVKPLVYWTRFFIIATAFSRPQIDAIGTKIKDLAEKQYGRVASGDSKPNSWTLLDFGDVVVHIFLPQQRAFYNLEEFYGNATLIELPFENQQPFRS
ncbi:unnamed protein product [Camellia sinensis]